MPSPSPRTTRNSFSSAVDAFVSTMDGIGDDSWERPATDLWTVRQLAAHTVRGMHVITEYLDADPGVAGAEPAVLLPDAAAYFRTGLSYSDAHARIAERGAAAADAAGPDLPAHAREVASAAVGRVADTPDEQVLVHIAGSIRFLDYLDTRVTELVLHTADLQLASGLALMAPPDAAALVAGILTDLVDRVDPLALALALSGRAGHLACNVLG